MELVGNVGVRPSWKAKAEHGVETWRWNRTMKDNKKAKAYRSEWRRRKWVVK
jgi:hypothetical protein